MSHTLPMMTSLKRSSLSLCTFTLLPFRTTLFRLDACVNVFSSNFFRVSLRSISPSKRSLLKAMKHHHLFCGQLADQNDDARRKMHKVTWICFRIVFKWVFHVQYGAIVLNVTLILDLATWCQVLADGPFLFSSCHFLALPCNRFSFMMSSNPTINGSFVGRETFHPSSCFRISVRSLLYSHIASNSEEAVFFLPLY